MFKILEKIFGHKEEAPEDPKPIPTAKEIKAIKDGRKKVEIQRIVIHASGIIENSIRRHIFKGSIYIKENIIEINPDMRDEIKGALEEKFVASGLVLYLERSDTTGENNGKLFMRWCV